MRDNSVVNFGENAKKTLFYEKMKIQVGLRHNFHGGGGLCFNFYWSHVYADLQRRTNFVAALHNFTSHISY